MKKESVILLLLAAIQFTNIIDFMIIMPLGPQVMRVFDINTTQFGIVVSAYTLSAGISGITAAFFLDRFDRKKSLLFTYAGFIIGTLFCALAPSFGWMVAARIFTGIFGGIMGAQVLAIVADLIPFERRGAAMGMIMGAFSVASIAGVPMGLFIATHFTWHAPFIAIAVMGVFIWLAAQRIIPPIQHHLLNRKKTDPLQILKAIFSSRNQRIALMMMVVLMVGHFMIIPQLSNYMVKNVGFSENELFYIYLSGGLVSLFSSPLFGRLADTFGKQRTFILLVLLNCIPVYLITTMPATAIWIAIVVNTFFFAFSGGRMIPAQALVSETVNPEHRGSFMSFISAMQQLGAGLAAYLGGLIITESADGKLEHYDTAGYLSILISLCSIFFITRIKLRKATV